MSGKIRRFHGINGVSIIINERHAGIRLGNDRDGDIFFNIADNRNQLILEPTEQFTPTASAPAASRETAASIAFPPLKILPSASTVMVHIIGSPQTVEAASTAARVSSILIMVSATIRSTPESFRIPICSSIHFESCLIGHLPGRSHHFTTGGNIRSNVNLMVCRIRDFS